MGETHQLELVYLAIRSGIMGHIEWKDSPYRLVRDDPELNCIVSPNDLRLLLRDFVLAGNVLDVRKETRGEYLEENPDDPYWYRAIVPVSGIPDGVFVELRIVDDDPKQPWVEIVSAHRQRS